jgi:hypothetical protein
MEITFHGMEKEELEISIFEAPFLCTSSTLVTEDDELTFLKWFVKSPDTSGHSTFPHEELEIVFITCKKEEIKINIFDSPFMYHFENLEDDNSQDEGDDISIKDFKFAKCPASTRMSNVLDDKHEGNNGFSHRDPISIHPTCDPKVQPDNDPGTNITLNLSTSARRFSNVNPSTIHPSRDTEVQSDDDPDTTHPTRNPKVQPDNDPGMDSEAIYLAHDPCVNPHPTRDPSVQPDDDPGIQVRSTSPHDVPYQGLVTDNKVHDDATAMYPISYAYIVNQSSSLPFQSKNQPNDFGFLDQTSDGPLYLPWDRGRRERTNQAARTSANKHYHIGMLKIYHVSNQVAFLSVQNQDSCCEEEDLSMIQDVLTVYDSKDTEQRGVVNV